ncbi:hypothetical protein [Streptomyces sp. NPDC006879]|uniref:hypothetical protein n=1 Tax=Streptomyces sp. NPDC006879 TaxID=3364767 RepID=UPI0036CF5700
MATSGGFAGLQESVVVNEDGSYTLRSGGKPAGAGRLSPARLAELRAALEESDFRSLPPQRTGGGSSVFDAITYTITYEGHRVVTSDPLPAPALRRIIAAVPHRDGR